MAALQPLEVQLLDCRRGGRSPTARGNEKYCKILQWNIERGYKLDGIVAELRRLDADILCLQARTQQLCNGGGSKQWRSLTKVSQELDVGCDRSNGADCGRVIAEALGAFRRLPRQCWGRPVPKARPSSAAVRPLPASQA